ARLVHPLPGGVDRVGRVAAQQPVEMLHQANDRLVAELAVRDLAEAVAAVLAPHADERGVHVLNDAAAVLVADMRGERIAQEDGLDPCDAAHGAASPQRSASLTGSRAAPPTRSDSRMVKPVISVARALISGV